MSGKITHEYRGPGLGWTELATCATFAPSVKILTGYVVINVLKHMLKNNKKLAVCVGVLLLPPALFAQQAGSETLLIDAGPCLKFETSVERLVCFEEQAKAAQARAGAAGTATVNSLPVLKIQGTAPAATPAAAVAPVAPLAPVAAETTPTPAATAVADPQAAFGLPEPTASEQEEQRNELRSTIASLRELQPNQYVITLENGQVWKQMHSQRYALTKGQQVRIYPTRWGSAFRLSAEELGGFVQVERVK